MAPEQASRDRGAPPIIAGSVGGLCAAIFSYPLDTLKVRVQTGRTEKVFQGICSGLLTPIAMNPPVWASLNWGYSTGCSLSPDEKRLSSALGGFTAGITCSVVYCPMQCVKCTAQAYKCSTLEAFRVVWRFGGLRRGLYRGYLPTLGFELPGYTVFFVCYEEAKLHLPGNGSFVQHFAAAALASLAESTIGMPGDTVRTRYQTDHSFHSPLACVKELLQGDGIRGLYRGYPLRQAFGIVNNGVSLAVIEGVNRWWAG